MTTMQKPTRILFRYSKRRKELHKYVGLIGLAYFLIMAISGVLLNHPSLIRGISVPQLAGCSADGLRKTSSGT